MKNLIYITRLTSQWESMAEEILTFTAAFSSLSQSLHIVQMRIYTELDSYCVTSRQNIFSNISFQIQRPTFSKIRVRQHPPNYGISTLSSSPEHISSWTHTPNHKLNYSGTLNNSRRLEILALRVKRRQNPATKDLCWQFRQQMLVMLILRIKHT